MTLVLIKKYKLFIDLIVGVTYSNQGEFEIALDYFESSLAIKKVLYGEDSLKTAKNLHDIGMIIN